MNVVMQISLRLAIGAIGFPVLLESAYGADASTKPKAQVVVTQLSPTLVFTNVTGPSGTGGPSNGGEFGGHGAAWADVTGDGRPDLHVTMIHNSPMSELFYRNIDGSSFAEEAAARGIDDYDNGSHGGAWADLDNDGDYDLINAATWFEGVTLNARNEVYENGGGGSFTNRTAGSGFENVQLGSRGIAAFDFDRDGDLDVFINNWGPDQENEFYRNDGGWTFTRIDNGLRGIGGVQGCTDTDFDNDGDIDLLVGRGYGTMGGQNGPVMVMRNIGGSFSDVTSLVGLDSSAPQQQGSVLCDINNDGWLDLHIQRDNGDSLLYLNDGDGTFTQTTVSDGPGFMAAFEDLDNDGDQDMVYAGDNKVYLNDGAGGFAASATFDPGPINDPRAVSFADIDNDGDMDFFYAQKRTYSILIRNDLSGGGNWLKVRLISPQGQAGAFGARVCLYEPGNAGVPSALVAMREARSNQGYLGQNEPVLHFGVGTRADVDVQVRFVDGTLVTQAGVAVNQTLVVDGGPPSAPAIAQVTPDPDTAIVGTEYVRTLRLLQGTLPVTWSVVQGPPGLQVDANGRVSGWTPAADDAGQTINIEIRAANNQGADAESWQVRPTALPAKVLGEYPFDAGAEGWSLEVWKAGQYDTGSIAWTPSDGNPDGCLYATGNGGTNNDDSCTREGGRAIRTISTADCSNIQILYDVRATLNAPPPAGCGGGCGDNLLNGTCDDQLVVFYSTTGPDGPWIAAQTLREAGTLPAAWATKQIDLSAVPGAFDNPAFSLRFDWQFNTSGDAGRLDNIRVMGNPSLAFLSDFDNDEDVDQEDFGFFQICLQGEGQPYCQGCGDADLDGDGDVDQGDFELIRSCVGGANQPPACSS